MAQAESGRFQFNIPAENTAKALNGSLTREEALAGSNPTSPVHTVTRTDIEQSGYSQIGDAMRSLPENFSGGQNPGVAAVAPSIVNVGNSNISNASIVNLRGLVLAQMPHSSS